MIDLINKAWGWLGIEAVEIIDENDFGNLIFIDKQRTFWRICPEEVYCRKIANSKTEFEKLKLDDEFIEDWNMTEIISAAKSVTGELETGQKYCLKMPALINGNYEAKNYGIAPFEELIEFSGSLAKQTEGLEDGQRIKIDFKN